MKYFSKVSRGNIYLSPINSEDCELWTKRVNDRRITDGMNQTKGIFSIDKGKEFLERYGNDSDPALKAFTIVNKKNDKMLGIINLGNIDYIDRVARLSITIGDFEEHNKGYGTDAINAILLFGFHTLNLLNIDLHVFSFNEGAIKCYKKCGFEEYGRRKETHYCNGKFRDEIYMDITKSEREKKNKEYLNIVS